MVGRLWPALSAVILSTTLFAGASRADSGGQVFFRGGLSFLKNTRGGQIFTDTGAANGINDGTLSWNVGAGLDTALVRKIGPGDLIGEIVLDYAHFSQKTVLQTTSALTGGTATSSVNVSEFAAVVAAKYRFEAILDGKLRPWIIPFGLAFLVNSPPSNDSNYLDLGIQLGAGIEYKFIAALSVGLDFRYTFAIGQPGFKASYGTSDLYLGINF